MTALSSRRSATVVGAIALQLFNFGCSGRECQAPDKLPLRVQGYCGQVAYDVKRAAEEFESNAPRLDSANPDERKRSVEALQSRSIAMSSDLRRAALADLQMRLVFCIQTRQVDDAQMTSLQVRVDKLITELGPDLIGGALPTTEATISGLKDLAALAAQINSMPLVN